MSGVDIAGLVEELRPFAAKTLGSIRIDVSEVRKIVDALTAQAAELAEARGLIDRLRLEAQIRAGEARCHKATVHEAYQVCSGAKGEPGNWHGAEPIRKALTEATRQRDEALAALKASEEALEPFAKIADIFDHVAGNRAREGEIMSWVDHRVGERVLTVEALRRARSALENGSAPLADATNNPPSDPGTEQREAGRC